MSTAPRIVSALPRDRTREGEAWIEGANGARLAGPWRCLGKSDNGRAADRGNPTRDPRKPWGDHPCGEYEIVAPYWLPAQPKQSYTYGPGRVKLNPLSGDALAREQAEAGDVDLRIHGGDLRELIVNAIKRFLLRPSFGCLRVENEVALAIREWVLGRVKLPSGTGCYEPVRLYVCRERG